MADNLSLPPEVLASLAAKRLGFTTAADTARQQADQGYNDQLYNLDTWGKDQARSLDNQFGSNNLFNSGIRVDSQGRLQRNIGDRRGQIDVGHSNSLANIQDMLAQELAGVSDQSAQYALDFNRTQAQQSLADAQNAANAGTTDLQSQIDALQAAQAPAAPAQYQNTVPIQLAAAQAAAQAALPKTPYPTPSIGSINRRVM